MKPANPLLWLRGHAAWIILGAGLSLSLFALWRSAHFGEASLQAEVQALRAALADERSRADALEARLAAKGGALAGDPAKSDLQGANGSGWGVQLASFADSATATRAWGLMSRQPDFNGLSGRVSAHAGSKGTVFRLMAGPFASIAEAQAFCARQPARAANCLPALFNGTPVE